MGRSSLGKMDDNRPCKLEAIPSTNNSTVELFTLVLTLLQYNRIKGHFIFTLGDRGCHCMFVGKSSIKAIT